MNEEEIAYKLIELYYTNVGIFKSYCMSVKDLAEKYKVILQLLK